MTRKSLPWPWGAAAGVVLLASLPYLIVAATTPGNLTFTGLLSNPLDGNSYLAKMRQGYAGSWQFHLPYTATDHPGAFLFLYYLFLGHLARWTGLSLTALYHLARAVNGFFLLLVADRFAARVLPIPAMDRRRRAFFLVALSSGLGWLTLPLLGNVEAERWPVDLWMPEANTFYALFANPHFPLAMALMLLIAGWGTGLIPSRSRTPLLMGATVALALIQPFAVPALFLILGAFLGLRGLRGLQNRQQGRIAWPTLRAEVGPLFLAGLAAAPILLYDAWVVRTNPALAGWNAQNLTPSPPVWAYLVGYGLLLPPALLGAVRAARRRSDGDLLLLAWVGVTAPLLYAPFPLQRRLVLGLHIPLALLAEAGLQAMVTQGRPRLARGLAAATLPGTAFLLLLSLIGGLSRSDLLFLTRGERAALDRLADHPLRATLVLAAPETGLFIPAWSGQRVLYGHPFETVRAEAMKEKVAAFFAPTATLASRQALLRSYDVDYLLVGPRERVRMGGRDLPVEALGLTAVWSEGDVTLYKAIRRGPRSQKPPRPLALGRSASATGSPPAP